MEQGHGSLRRALEAGRMMLAPFVYDALQAKIAEAAGFEAVYMTGFGTAAARGLPDVGLLTMTAMALWITPMSLVVDRMNSPGSTRMVGGTTPQ